MIMIIYDQILSVIIEYHGIITNGTLYNNVLMLCHPPFVPSSQGTRWVPGTPTFLQFLKKVPF